MTIRRPAVIPYPESIQQLQKGFDQLADLLALTLGPTQGVVLSSKEGGARPEVLTDAATIARRFLALPDPRQDVGAMLLRNLVWKMEERLGDGGATAAVLAQALLRQGLRYVMAGANPMAVLDGIRQGARAAREELARLSQPVQGEADLQAVALSVTGLPELSDILAELYDLLGVHAHITIEDYILPYLERVYLDGGRWLGQLASPYLVNAPASRKAVLTECQVALYNGPLSQGDQVLPLLELAIQQKGSEDKPRPLVLVAQAIREEALNTLVATHTRGGLKIAAFALKRAGEKALVDLQDLAWLSGAAVIDPQTGRSFDYLQAAELGRFRRVEAGPEDLVAVGGEGDRAALRAQIEVLEAQRRGLPWGDEQLSEIELRLGRLTGSVAVLKLGALTKPEREFQHRKAEQGLKALQAALEEGLLPGGGTAFLHCLEAVRAVEKTLNGDSALGARAWQAALPAPFERLCRNAGIETPGVVREEILRQPPGSVYDLAHGRLVEARQGGLLDPTRVLRMALETAASGAAMALSTDTLVLKRKPKVSYEP